VQWPESAALAAKTGFPGCDVAIMTGMKAGLYSTRETLAKYKPRAAAVDLPVDFRKDEETFSERLEIAAGCGVVRGRHRLPAHGDLHPVLKR